MPLFDLVVTDFGEGLLQALNVFRRYRCAPAENRAKQGGERPIKSRVFSAPFLTTGEARAQESLKRRDFALPVYDALQFDFGPRRS